MISDMFDFDDLRKSLLGIYPTIGAHVYYLVSEVCNQSINQIASEETKVQINYFLNE